MALGQKTEESTMKTMMVRLAIAMGLLVLPVLGMGCVESEPEGSCTTTGFSSDPNGGGNYERCQPHSTASACAQSGGSFQEGDDCVLFGLFQAITAN